MNRVVFALHLCRCQFEVTQADASGEKKPSKTSVRGVKIELAQVHFSCKLKNCILTAGEHWGVASLGADMCSASALERAVKISERSAAIAWLCRPKY